MAESLKKFENVVCPFCATLCDDLVIHTQGNKVVKAQNACNLSRGVFMNAHKDWATPMVRGKEVDYDTAVDTAAMIMATAQNPLVYGLSATDVEAQKKCIELADLTGANLDNASSI